MAPRTRAAQYGAPLMEFAEVVRRRRMVRSYEDRPIPAAMLDRVLGHALRAPSAGFTQGTELVVLDTAEDRELFWSPPLEPAGRAGRARQAGLERAPVIV